MPSVDNSNWGDREKREINKNGRHQESIIWHLLALTRSLSQTVVDSFSYRIFRVCEFVFKQVIWNVLKRGKNNITLFLFVRVWAWAWTWPRPRSWLWPLKKWFFEWNLENIAPWTRTGHPGFFLSSFSIGLKDFHLYLQSKELTKQKKKKLFLVFIFLSQLQPKAIFTSEFIDWGENFRVSRLLFKWHLGTNSSQKWLIYSRYSPDPWTQRNDMYLAEERHNILGT